MLHCADIQFPRNRSERFFLRIHNAVSIMIFLAVIYFFVKWLSRIHKGKSGRKNVTSVTWLQEDFVLSVFTKYLIDAACNHVKNPQHGNCDQQISDAPGQVGDPVGIVLWMENLHCSCQKCRKICKNEQAKPINSASICWSPTNTAWIRMRSARNYKTKSLSTVPIWNWISRS